MVVQLEHDTVITQQSDDDVDAIRIGGTAANDTLENAENDQYDGREQSPSAARPARNAKHQTQVFEENSRSQMKNR